MSVAAKNTLQKQMTSLIILQRTQKDILGSNPKVKRHNKHSTTIYHSKQQQIFQGNEKRKYSETSGKTVFFYFNVSDEDNQNVDRNNEAYTQNNAIRLSQHKHR